MCIYVDKCERTGVYKCTIILIFFFFFLEKESDFSGIRK